MYRPKNPSRAAAIALFILAGAIGLLPAEFVISALIFALIIRGGLYVIKLATTYDPKAKEFDKT